MIEDRYLPQVTVFQSSWVLFCCDWSVIALFIKPGSPLKKQKPFTRFTRFEKTLESTLQFVMYRDYPDIHSIDVHGRSVLHMAASCGNFECLQTLCKSSNKETLNRSDRFGFTALHYAVQGANTYCAKLLLEAGCKANVGQHSLYTPLHLAASYGYSGLVALLCQYGANVHARSLAKETPLLLASRSGIRILEKIKVKYSV